MVDFSTILTIEWGQSFWIPSTKDAVEALTDQSYIDIASAATSRAARAAATTFHAFFHNRQHIVCVAFTTALEQRSKYGLIFFCAIELGSVRSVIRTRNCGACGRIVSLMSWRHWGIHCNIISDAPVMKTIRNALRSPMEREEWIEARRATLKLYGC